MSGLRLVRLTVIGDGVPDAAVDFGAGLTVIYGSSNTGKSYVVEALDFMLGATALKPIPEAVRYTDVMLSLTLPDDSPLTLVRKISGGQYRAYQSHLREATDRIADFTLSPTHGSKASTKLSLSRFLLQTIGLDGRLLRKNQRNVTVPLSFRNLCLLCIVDETKVQAKASPATSGQYVTKTSELSLLKLLLQGDDDSKFAQEAGAIEKRKVSKGKTEILEQAIAELLRSVEGRGGVIELSQQLARLSDSVQSHTSAIDAVLERRASVVAEQATVMRSLNTYQSRLDEVGELLSRFALLRAKYNSDLARLDMMREAGTLLGFFRPGVCVFCGAEVEHQAAEIHNVEEVTAFGVSILAEIEKTSGLRDDLDVTISDLQTQEVRLRQAIAGFVTNVEQLRADISMHDGALQPERTAMEELLSARSTVEASLATYNQIERLRALKATVEPEEEDELPPVPGISERVLDEFSEVIRDVLRQWSVAHSGNIRYSKSADDILVDDQPRSSHGKGMRAILHAAFTTALAQYCFDRDLEHPGFIVLDSPLLPYREPELGVAEAPTPEEFKSVADSFYSYFDSWFDGQSIIVENVDPPAGLSDEAVLIRFTGSAESGRFGFFPQRVPSSSDPT